MTDPAVRDSGLALTLPGVSRLFYLRNVERAGLPPPPAYSSRLGPFERDLSWL